MPNSMNSWEHAVAYHEQTKHHFHRSARSLGYMDWANQPNPFRRFEPAPSIPLKLSGAESAEAPAYDDLFEPGDVPPRPVCFDTISALCEFSLALSAWKQFGESRWALRINPSSGNLHPTEGYLVTGPIEGLHHAAGVYHYAPKEHALERRTEFSVELWNQFAEGFPPGAILFGLTSIHWREAWKYGERAYRYCQHDAGHALAAVTFSAAIQGWTTHRLDGVSDVTLSRLLGLDRADDFRHAEYEYADALLAIVPRAPQRQTVPSDLPVTAVDGIASGSWHGRANRLSESHNEWRLIDDTAAACVKPRTPTVEDDAPAADWSHPLAEDRQPVPAGQIIRQRRSAVAMDGRTSISADQFFLMMDRVLPRFDRVPWTALGPPVCVHLGLFVHRVDGLAPGLYFLVRSPNQMGPLRAATRPSFTWQKPPGCPDALPLYQLLEGDARRAAGQICCGQSIAADGAFAVAMIAEFKAPLQRHGGWFYRRLHWETGMIGQVLYLEAEAAGVRATGIGCFFDDPTHDLFGLEGRAYQTLYHFTVGGPVDDLRLMTWPPYSQPEASA